MKKTGDIIVQFEAMQRDIIKRMYGDKEINQLTEDEVKRVNERTKELGTRYMMNEKLPAKPKLVLQYYQQAAPFMRTVQDEEKEARLQIHNRAVESYAAGQANLAELQAGVDAKLLDRSDQRFYRLASNEEKSKYSDYLKKSKSSYYENSKLSKEEIKKAIEENEKNLTHLKFDILFNLLETKEEFFSKDMSDEELIEKYPDIINSVYVILEAEGIVSDVKKRGFSYDEIPPSKIQKCRKLFNNIQDKVTKIDKRIATMADPYYTELTIEDLWDAGLTQVNEVLEGDSEADLLEEEGLQVNPVDSSKIVDEYDWQKLFDEDINTNAEIRENQKKFDVKENFLGLMMDVQFVKKLENQALAGSTYGINFDESKRMMYYCDKDGNECNGSKFVDELLNQHGEIYLVSRFGDMDPVPVMQDKAKRGFSVLVGAEQISKAKDMDVPPEPQKPGRLTYFRNWFRQIWDDDPLPEIQEYDAAKAKYDNAIAYNEKRRQLANHTIPDVIKQKVESVKKINKDIAAQRKDRREQMLKDFEDISKIPDNIYDTSAFESKLADLMIGKAFVDPEKSMFRTLIFEKFNPYGEDFDEKKMAEALKQSDGFREFVWELKNKYPKIIENLKSGEEFVQRPKDALEEAATYFCSRYEDNRDKKLDIFKMKGKEYAAFKEERKQLENFEKHINELAELKEYKKVAEAAKKVLKEGSLESKTLLASLNDGQLYNCNGYMEKNPEMDLSKALSDILAQQKAEKEQKEKGLLGFDPSTATKEQKRDAIKLLNEDFIKAGIAPISEEEIQTIFNEGEKRLELYEFAKEIKKEIQDIEQFGQDHHFETTKPFERSRPYVFSRKNTEQAKADNDALQKELKTREGTEKYLRNLHDKLSKMDEREFFAHSEMEQMALLKKDVAFGLLCWELKHVFDVVSSQKMHVLSKEEMARFEERIPIFQSHGEYKSLAYKNGSPINVLMPNRPIEDVMKLQRYYIKNHKAEELEYIEGLINTKGISNRTQCSKATIEALAKKGFFGMPDENVTYEAFENDKKLKSRMSAINRVYEEPNVSVRLVKHVKEKINGQDVIKDYETVVTSQDARDYYHNYNLTQKLADKYPQYKGLAFSENARMAAAQKAVILNFLPKVTAQDEFLKDIETKKIDRFIENVLQGKNEAVSYIMLQSPEVADKMLIELTNDEEPKRFESALAYYNGGIRKTNGKLHPADDVINALFAPKTDPLNINYVFTEDRQPIVGTEVIEAQKKIDAIEITPPEGYTDEDVIAANYALFFSPENLKKNVTFMQNTRGDQATLYHVVNPIYDGGEYIITDLLQNGHRLNTHMIRTLVPDVRTKTKDILADLTEENKRVLVDAAKKAIATSTNMLRAREDITKDEAAILMRTTKAMYDLLDKPDFKDMVSFTEEDLKWKKYMDVNYKLLQEMAGYENKLYGLIDKKGMTEEYLGKKSVTKVGDDAQIKEAYLEYAARKLYFDRVIAANTTYREGMTSRYGDGVEADSHKYSRPMSRIENNCLENPDEYIKYMKEQLVASKTNYQEMLDTTNYSDFQSRLGRAVDKTQQSFHEAYARQWKLNGFFTAFIEEAKNKEGYGDLIAEIKELPCMKNPDDVKELTSEERKNQISIYRDMENKIKEKHFERGGYITDEDGERHYEPRLYTTSYLEKELNKVTALMERNETLFKAERVYENAAYVKNLYKERKISDEQVFELAAERKSLYETELQDNNCYLDCPTKDNYKKLILDMIGKAKQLGISDKSFDSAVIGLKDCFGSGAEETEIISAMNQLDKAEKALADQMLNDDSNELRDRYAFVVNLQSKLEAYNDAGTLIESAKNPDSVFGVAYENAKKLEENYKRIQEKESESVRDKKEGEKTLQFRKLASLARGSMENIRNAIRNEALGNTEEGIKSLKNGEDIATVAVFNTLMSADKDSFVRAMLEKKGADAMIKAAMSSEVMKNKCDELTVDKIGEVLADSRKFNEYLITTDEVLKSEKTATKLHMKKDIPQVNGPVG